MELPHLDIIQPLHGLVVLGVHCTLQTRSGLHPLQFLVAVILPVLFLVFREKIPGQRPQPAMIDVVNQAINAAGGVEA